jgi:hypothetical protein
MTETERLLQRQAQWQRERRLLSWPEKIRQAERLRSTVVAFQAQRRHLHRRAQWSGEGGADLHHAAQAERHDTEEPELDGKTTEERQERE